MSILTQLFHRQITFSQAAQSAAEWASALTAKDPAAAAAVGATLSIVKQGASNAVMLADSALGPHIQPAADAVEAALDTVLAKATGGLSVPFNPIMDAMIDQFADVVHTAAHAWALKAKATLATAPASPPPV